MLPLHSVCAQRQSLSGVLPMDSHAMLQYLPEVATQEQPGGVHLSRFGAATSLLQLRMKTGSSKSNISHQDRALLYGKEHTAEAAISFANGSRRRRIDARGCG